MTETVVRKLSSQGADLLCDCYWHLDIYLSQTEL